MSELAARRPLGLLHNQFKADRVALVQAMTQSIGSNSVFTKTLWIPGSDADLGGMIAALICSHLTY